MSDKRYSREDLGRALRETLEFLEPAGWDQPAQIFALVPTAVLAESHPGLVNDDDDSALSPVAQDPLEVTNGEEPYAELEQFLATASWPPMVAGVALVLEIVVVPPEAEADLDSAFEPLLADPSAAEAAARSVAKGHPGSRVARLAVGALRDGSSLGLLRVRDADPDPTGAMELLTHPELGSTLRDALVATLEPGTD